MRVSELVTIDAIKSWNDGDIITIEAGTGVGKSYFIKNNLYALAKKENKRILFLIHRSDCVNQFQMEIEEANKTDVIDIKTYQSLEAGYINNKYFSLRKYKYIVCDEFHYFMSDAPFNKFTDISLSEILNETDNIRIMMSATGDMVKKYINNYKKLDVKAYKIPIKYNFIKSLTFFNKDESLEDIARKVIEANKKAIFFIKSVKDAYELHRKFKDESLFNCSKHNDKYKFVDEEKITSLLKNERFEESLLITTTAMDAGVNIRDKELQYIICDVKDTGTLIQCIGRKRIDEKDKNDGIHLLIKTINNKTLGGMITQINNKLERARYLREHDMSTYLLKYPRDYDKWNIVYNDIIKDERNKTVLKINDLIYFKCVIDGAEIDTMKREKFGYCKFLARKFGFYDPDIGYNYVLLDEKNDKDKLVSYLESVFGDIMLTVSDRKELIGKINVKQDGKLLKSLDSLNSALREQQIDYYIKQFETSRMEKGKKKNYKSAWKVMKMVDECPTP